MEERNPAEERKFAWPTDEQQANLHRALVAGHMMDIVAARGGTGDKRSPLSTKEQDRRRKRRQMAKASRKANRG